MDYQFVGLPEHNWGGVRGSIKSEVVFDTYLDICTVGGMHWLGVVDIPTRILNFVNQYR